uniref:BZIP domain-containing protein n=1 Tax=Panagrellus redivivus TaxID=6233 RepID=A0A7E4ZZJ0_PANRE
MSDSDSSPPQPKRGRPRCADDGSTTSDTRKRRVYERVYRQKKKSETAALEQKYRVLLAYFNSTRDLVCIQQCACHPRLAHEVRTTVASLAALNNDTPSRGNSLSDSDVRTTKFEPQ